MTTNHAATHDAGKTLLSVDRLAVSFSSLGQSIPAVQDVTFDVGRGEVVALVGESGSGKSVTAMSILGLLPKNARVEGRITLDGADMLSMTERQRRRLRAHQMSVVFQNPLTALNPVYTIGFQLVEAIRVADRTVSRAAARARAHDLLVAVGIPDPGDRLRFYPHQLSGGQCQRVMIAMALSTNPRLLIADEPTTALDVTVQAEILQLLRELSGRLGTAVLLITHDMGVVADLADRVVVMESGSIVEQAPVEELFDHPSHSYTRTLLHAVPRIRDHSTRLTEHPEPDVRPHPQDGPPPALEVRDLVVQFPARSSDAPVRAVDGVTLVIPQGVILGLVGESGSGKSTLSRCAAGLIRPTSGHVDVLGTQIDTASREHRQAVRRRIGVVFQNPADSLDPRLTVGDSIAEPIRVHQPVPPAALRQRVADLLDAVALPSSLAGRYPRELSGGQLQRVCLARSVALSPDLLIADEPTSSLDVSVQAQLLHMLKELHARMGFACLFVSHNLAVVDQTCDRIAIMRNGTIVEQGPPAQVLGAPRATYARQLLQASLVPDPREQRRRRTATPNPTHD